MFYISLNWISNKINRFYQSLSQLFYMYKYNKYLTAKNNYLRLPYHIKSQIRNNNNSTNNLKLNPTY